MSTPGLIRQDFDVFRRNARPGRAPCRSGASADALVLRGQRAPAPRGNFFEGSAASAKCQRQHRGRALKDQTLPREPRSRCVQSDGGCAHRRIRSGRTMHASRFCRTIRRSPPAAERSMRWWLPCCNAQRKQTSRSYRSGSTARHGSRRRRIPPPSGSARAMVDILHAGDLDQTAGVHHCHPDLGQRERFVLVGDVRRRVAPARAEPHAAASRFLSRIMRRGSGRRAR